MATVYSYIFYEYWPFLYGTKSAYSYGKRQLIVRTYRVVLFWGAHLPSAGYCIQEKFKKNTNCIVKPMQQISNDPFINFILFYLIFFRLKWFACSVFCIWPIWIAFSKTQRKQKNDNLSISLSRALRTHSLAWHNFCGEQLFSKQCSNFVISLLIIISNEEKNRKLDNYNQLTINIWQVYKTNLPYLKTPWIG